MDDWYRFRFHLEFSTAVKQPILGFFLRDRLGTDLIGVNTHQEGCPLPAVKPGDQLTVDFVLPLRLRPGAYSISPGLSYHQDEMRYLDWQDHAFVFEIIDLEPGRTVFGMTHPEVCIEIQVPHSQPACT
jgi:lipopolysaccharide transport system ATP-binding protein